MMLLMKWKVNFKQWHTHDKSYESESKRHEVVYQTYITDSQALHNASHSLKGNRISTWIQIKLKVLPLHLYTVFTVTILIISITFFNWIHTGERRVIIAAISGPSINFNGFNLT